MTFGGLAGTFSSQPAEPVPIRAQMLAGSLLVDLLNLYSLLIIIRALISWFGVSPANQVVRFLNAVTDPVIVPIQNVIPPIGGTIDISPLIALVLVQLVKGLVIRLFW